MRFLILFTILFALLVGFIVFFKDVGKDESLHQDFELPERETFDIRDLKPGKG